MIFRLPPGGGDGSGGELEFTNNYIFIPNSNELWLQINGTTNALLGWTALLTIHVPATDTHLTHDLLYTPTLNPPIDWRFLVRCTSTNVGAYDICPQQGFFDLTQTNGNLTVTTNVTPQQMAQMLVPPGVLVTNAIYTGADVARGTFAGGNGCGLPIDRGIILATGFITNAIGPNNDSGEAGYFSGTSALGQPGDADLSSLVAGGDTYDAAVLEFDIISTNFLHCNFNTSSLLKNIRNG